LKNKYLPSKRELKAKIRGIFSDCSSGSTPSLPSKSSREDTKWSQLASACQGNILSFSMNLNRMMILAHEAHRNMDSLESRRYLQDNIKKAIIAKIS
jgi:hypothetical protein